MKAFVAIHIAGLILVIGLILAASGGSWFPWPNAFGLILTFVGAIVCRRLAPHTDSTTRPGPWRDQLRPTSFFHHRPAAVTGKVAPLDLPSNGCEHGFHQGLSK